MFLEYPNSREEDMANQLIRINYTHSYRETDASGTITLCGADLKQRLQPRLNSECYAVRSVDVWERFCRMDYRITVDRVATVAGVVTNAKDKPVAGRELVLADPTDHITGYYSLRRTSTDSRGNFVFGYLPPGDYRVRFADGSPQPLAAPVITVRPGEKQTVRVVVP